jgi:hypothetical protein
MFKTIQTEQLITATGGLSLTNSIRPQLPSPINVKPPVWPRKVDGHRAVPSPSSPHVGF